MDRRGWVWTGCALAVVGTSAFFISRALAKDLMIVLNDQEQAALRRILDSATKAEGTQIAPATVYFLNKLNTAMEVVERKDGDQPKDAEKK